MRAKADLRSGAGEAKIDLDGRAVSVRQETRYPWDGSVRITVALERKGEFALHVRVPGWVQNLPVPTDLYRFAETGDAKVVIRVNGKPAALDLDKGFARIRRVWKKGDTVEVVFPMDARRVTAHPLVKDDEGFVAVERGLLVYCAEGTDNGGKALNIILPDKTVLRPEIQFRRG